MTRRSADDWLADILLWGERLEVHLRDQTWTAFLANTLLQDAVSKCIEAIGEAAGKLDDLDGELSDRFFGMQLRQARRSRDRLAHGYYHVDLAIIWQTATESIPRLIEAAKVAKAAMR